MSDTPEIYEHFEHEGYGYSKDGRIWCKRPIGNSQNKSWRTIKPMKRKESRGGAIQISRFKITGKTSTLKIPIAKFAGECVYHRKSIGLEFRLNDPNSGFHWENIDEYDYSPNIEVIPFCPKPCNCGCGSAYWKEHKTSPRCPVYTRGNNDYHKAKRQNSLLAEAQETVRAYGVIHK